MLLSTDGRDHPSQPQRRQHGEPVGALPVFDDVRSLELSILSQARPKVVVESDADRGRARSLVSLFGPGVRPGHRRTGSDCALAMALPVSEGGDERLDKW